MSLAHALLPAIELYNRDFDAKLSPETAPQPAQINLPDGELIRELYTPAGESSLINNHEVLISSRINGEGIPVYIADFSTTNYTFNVEAHGLSESEFIALLKSLLSD